MKKPVWMTILAFGALLVASCTAKTTQRFRQAEEKGRAPTKNELAQATIAAAASKGGQGSPVYTKLITPIVAEDRLKKVVSGGRDPFATLLVAPKIIDKQPIIREKLPSPPPILPAKIDPQPNKEPHQIAIALITDPGPVEAPEVNSLASLPKIRPLPPIQTARLPILTTPSLPQKARSAVTALGTGSAQGTSRAEIAEAVKVSGVIELGSGKRAIVLLPGSKTHRYVSEGEWLAQGKVQVKRIEISDSGFPVVILSENGREVVKMVGGRRNTIAVNF